MNETLPPLALQVSKILSEKSEERFSAARNDKNLYTLTNKNGIIVQVTNYGGKIVRIFVPNRFGVLNDIVLGYDTIEGYLSGNPYFGAICGRYANRIANGKFTIDGQSYQLPVNNGPNLLHGGSEGFNNQTFKVTSIEKQKVTLIYVSKDGEMGFPGNLTLQVVYTLTDQDELCLDYEATTDKSTFINICSHSFFNLAGEGTGDILGHELMIKADRYTPVNDTMIPTGETIPVQGTPLDFSNLTPIGDRINDPFIQLEYGNGYDHNWIINKNASELGLAAICYEPHSGRMVEVYTTQPGMQLYTGNWLDGSDKGKDGHVYLRRSALCLETQHFPDSPNKKAFPSTLLKPGEIYRESCIYKFSVK